MRAEWPLGDTNVCACPTGASSCKRCRSEQLVLKKPFMKKFASLILCCWCMRSHRSSDNFAKMGIGVTTEEQGDIAKLSLNDAVE